MSAMVDQDMVFRAGLLIAILTLAGIFGASIGGRMFLDGDKELELISSEMRSIVRMVQNSKPGSSAVISFGDTKNDDITSFSLPGRVNGGSFLIDVKSGLVSIEQDGRREIVISGEWIVPSFSPLNSFFVQGNLSGGIGALSDGYRLHSPCLLVIEKPPGPPSNEVFVFPFSMYNDTGNSDLYEISQLVHEPGQLLPGWGMSRSIAGERIFSLDSSLLLLLPHEDHTTSGVCPIPIILPYGTIIIGKVSSDGSYDVELRKEALLMTDGTIDLSFQIEIHQRSDTTL